MKLNGNILIADDEKNIREGLKISLLKDNHRIFLAERTKRGGVLNGRPNI